MNNQFPCIDCLTFVICKSRANNYRDDSLVPSLMEITRKCEILENYIKRNSGTEVNKDNYILFTFYDLFTLKLQKKERDY